MTELVRNEATVTASSEQRPELTTPETTVDLDETDLGLHISYDGHLDSVELLLEGVPDGADGPNRASVDGGVAGAGGGAALEVDAVGSLRTGQEVFDVHDQTS